MNTYITLLRGINVSGQKLIKMDDLKKLYKQLGFENVRSYIQSGNVKFETGESDIRRISVLIRSIIMENYGFDVPIIVRTNEEIQKVIDDLPFSNYDLTKLAVTFLDEIPKNIPKEEIESVKTDLEEIVFSKNQIYLYYPNGFAKTKLSNKFFEKKLKVNATTRNWRTVNKLLEI